MAKKLVSCQIIVKGRVQGVGFRYFTEQIAGELSIKGFVKNMSDGNVEITAEGPADTINDFIRFIKRGPSLARVINTNISINDIDDYKYPDFRVGY